MKIIYNDIIPFRGSLFGDKRCMNVFGILFVRKGKEITIRTLQHEAIHTAQMKELLYIPFYILYILEWVIRLIHSRNMNKAYKTISFEREAYEHENNPNYLKTRKMYAIFSYICKGTTTPI